METKRMTRLIALMVLSLSGLTVTAAFADSPFSNARDLHKHHYSAPEIDPASAVTAITLLLGGITVWRVRNRKK
jgi:hypothetical protein